MIRHLDPRLWITVSGVVLAIAVGAALANLVTGHPWEAAQAASWGLPFWFLMNVARDLENAYDELDSRERHPAGRENS